MYASLFVWLARDARFRLGWVGLRECRNRPNRLRNSQPVARDAQCFEMGYWLTWKVESRRLTEFGERRHDRLNEVAHAKDVG